MRGSINGEGVENNKTVAVDGLGIGGEPNPLSMLGGATDGKDEFGAVDRHHPHEYKKWIHRMQQAQNANNSRPSSAFVSTERKSMARAATPDTYWPYNCHLVSSSTTGSINMTKQQARWGQHGKGFDVHKSGNAPDVVYQITTDEHVSVPLFNYSTSRDSVQLNIGSYGAAYNADDKHLSTYKRPTVVDFSKSQSHSKSYSIPDNRSRLNISHAATSPQIPGAVNYDTQLPRPDFLHKNDNINLDYNPGYSLRYKKSISAHVDWTSGHGNNFLIDKSNETDCNPSDEGIRVRHDTAPDMLKTTSRAQSFGAWQVTKPLDKVYSPIDPNKVTSRGCIVFEKQIGRDQRELALKQKLTRSDQFYDVMKPLIKGHTCFAKTLPRNKRGPTKFTM